MWLAEPLAHGLIRASFLPDTQNEDVSNLLRKLPSWAALSG